MFKASRESEEATSGYIDRKLLHTQTSEQPQLETLEDKVSETVKANNLLNVDNNEMGKEHLIFNWYRYRESAEVLFSGIEWTVRGNRLYKGARMVARGGEVRQRHLFL